MLQRDPKYDKFRFINRFAIFSSFLDSFMSDMFSKLLTLVSPRC